MKQLIDKSAVVAEIERQRKIYMYDVDNKHSFGRMTECNDLLVFLDTLETKEVDLEKEMDKEWNKCEPIDEGMGLEIASIEHEQFDNIAKHFFELGLKAQKGE